MTEQFKPEERVIQSLRALYRRYGYLPFKMSKFETYDLYMQNKDFLVSDSVITFTDTDGTLMALKPDVTLSIVKNYTPQRTALQKVYYNENVYRGGSGRTYREIPQTGLECLGDVGDYEICEVILLAVRSLAQISDRYVLDVSHMGIVTDLLSAASLSPDRQAALLHCMGEKNEHELMSAFPELETSSLQQLRQLMNLSGPICRTVETLAQRSDHPAVTQLQKLSRLLERSGMADRVELDFSILLDMRYYNGFVFRGYVEGIPTDILSGGQYDNLMKKMNKNGHGIGFAVYLDHLERLDTSSRVCDVDTVLLWDGSGSMEDFSQAVDQLSESGSVLVLKELPHHLTWGSALRYQEGRLEAVEDHG